MGWLRGQISLWLWRWLLDRGTKTWRWLLDRCRGRLAEVRFGGKESSVLGLPEDHAGLERKKEKEKKEKKRKEPWPKS